MHCVLCKCNPQWHIKAKPPLRITRRPTGQPHCRCTKERQAREGATALARLDSIGEPHSLSWRKKRHLRPTPVHAQQPSHRRQLSRRDPAVKGYWRKILSSGPPAGGNKARTRFGWASSSQRERLSHLQRMLPPDVGSKKTQATQLHNTLRKARQT